MDGAARFSQRDSMATILITVDQYHRRLPDRSVPARHALQEALKTYTILTVGDGLVTIIPSLLVSVAGGIVRHARRIGTLPRRGHRQADVPNRAAVVDRQRRPARARHDSQACPRYPSSPGWAYHVRGLEDEARRALEPPARDQGRRCRKGRAAPVADPMDAVLKLDELMLEVGVGLVPLVDAKQGGQLLARVKSLRKNLAQQLGFLVPSIHITDNLSLKEREYVIYLRGVEIARWEMKRDRLLAVIRIPSRAICRARRRASRHSIRRKVDRARRCRRRPSPPATPSSIIPPCWPRT